MDDNRSERLQAVKHAIARNQPSGSKTPQQVRARLRAAVETLPRLEQVVVEPITIGKMYGERVRHVTMKEAEGPPNILLYVHGGGFIAGDCATYRDVAGRLAKTIGAAVVTFEYRLAPEHRYPAANEDAYFAYSDLLEQGYMPSQIVLGGDSAGATLALMTLLRLRDEGRPMPAGAVLISPHTDLIHLAGESYRTNAELDPAGSKAANQAMLAAYWGREDEPPAVIFDLLQANWGGMPPMFIQAGSCELLLSDAVRLAGRLRESGTRAELDIIPEMWTAFNMLAGVLPEASEAYDRIGGFVRRVLGGHPA
ncbi:alpha/beta hydrolase [Paenibacillus aurantiacus]|uniref:Alpha/beta hydrolase n=1 Tax=Paenibacillus aurantiacus TaxID=1936118 RepID=A0ABV5KUR0_9BACL